MVALLVEEPLCHHSVLLSVLPSPFLFPSGPLIPAKYGPCEPRGSCHPPILQRRIRRSYFLRGSSPDREICKCSRTKPRNEDLHAPCFYTVTPCGYNRDAMGSCHDFVSLSTDVSRRHILATSIIGQMKSNICGRWRWKAAGRLQLSFSVL